MLCKDVIKIIERTYPRDCALEWDNVGLLAGRDDKQVKSIYVALDATDEVIEDAIQRKADMLVTHHPLIFGGLKQVTNQNFIGNRVLKLIQHDISYYAMHTNYDVKEMAAVSCDRLLACGELKKVSEPEVLEVTGTDGAGQDEGIGKIMDVKEMPLANVCRCVKEAFDLDTVKVFGNLSQSVGRIAVCPGSGKSVIGISLKKGADVLITGDIGHHEGIDAAAQGLAIVDAGHYGIEHIFTRDMKEYLEKYVPGAEVTAAPVNHPFVNV